ncbi:helix-turn-helix domain-containing protein [Microbacterium sp. BG28]|uniref:helix-turn-helix domain-containing protein n=1 Tax=Microbacterium sp. BG28 TaxID=3097356 RepID=UPI002A5987F5|nr:helix-turn-helix domain-containing protein [Microbacterium sp. BG28]MDY0830765.1 helix-turn-helix domain-containing protein [Microbacterium sp. BG28]
MSAPVVERTGRVLTTRDAAKYCGLAHQTFRNLLAAGEGPKVFKQGRLNAFYPVDLDAWIKSRLVDPAAGSDTQERAA